MSNKNLAQLKGIIVFILYFIYSKASLLPFKWFGIDYNTLSITTKVIYLLSIEFLFISVLYFIYKDKLKKDFLDFKKNMKPYLKKYIDYWAFALFLMIGSNLIIITLFPDSVATNQEGIKAILGVAPVYIFICCPKLFR